MLQTELFLAEIIISVSFDGEKRSTTAFVIPFFTLNLTQYSL